MTAIRTKAPTIARAFPAKAIGDRIRKELSRLAADAAVIREPWDPLFDSLAVVSVLCCIEEVAPGLAFAPEKVVRKGGYESLDSAAEHILYGVEKAWEKANH